ncbi:addiction module RelE/StbE family toxin [Rhodobium orientis]|uniref:type II toxin-antitoxin system RelE/ParE family toxin n=1 Tax=Rhodobium orientis TaxID=34017 RepID=UPI001475FBC2|nr:type II toxin-antitoxin system RelE/ParE family toxin [Rhodobium orientis]MBB4304052.1 addiction module RelE/StbE family toxin [Rhodobium orientis]
MNISFTADALADLENIHGFISEHDRQSAQNTIARILQSIAMLEQFPLIGRPGRVRSTRELTIPGLPYFAVYRIASETEVDVIGVLHTRMIYPRQDH